MKTNETKKPETAFETKALAHAFNLETLSESTGEFSGTAIVFDSLHDTSSWQLPDGWQDRVRPGAFTDTLAEHAKAKTLPLMLFMHERGNIPGVWTSVKESKTGLEVKGRVSPNAITDSGVPLLELMKMQAISGLSIGFRATRVSLDEESKVRSIDAVQLAEVSVVDMPGAGPSARITDVKSARGLEAGLLGLGLSRREAKALLAEGFGALEKPAVPAAVEPEPESEELAATKVSRQAAASSSKAEQLSDAAGEAHGSASVAHAAAAAGHRAAAHDHSMAAKQAADKGNADASAEFKATADAHDAKAGMHNAAVSAMQSCYQMLAAPPVPAPPAPAAVEVVAVEVGSELTAEEVAEAKALTKEIQDLLSQRDADGALRDATGSIAESVSDFVNQIRRDL